MGHFPSGLPLPAPEAPGLLFPCEFALINPQTPANPTRLSHTVSLQRSDRSRPASRGEGRCRHRETPARGPFPMGLRTSRGRARGGCRPSWAPSSCCCCSRAAAEAVAAGALCRSRRRGCGRAGDSAKREASAGPVCAIELLIHRKKKKRRGERKKKEVTCPGYTYAEKQQKEGKMKSEQKAKQRRGGGAGGGGGGAAGDRHPPV